MARINTGTMTVGIFAVLFGLVGAYALRAALTRPTPPAPVAPTRVNVPVASYDLPAGRRLTISDMSLIPMTREEMQQRGLPLDRLMVDTDQLVGRIVRGTLAQGQPFLTTGLYPEGTGPSITDRLQPGLRAVTIPIDDLASVGGSATEGSIVDVLFRSDAKQSTDPQTQPDIPQATMTLIEGAEVLAVGRNPASAGRDAGGPLDLTQTNRARNTNVLRSVTLAVTPEQANILETIRGEGNIYLALRASDATGNAPRNPMTLQELMGIRPPERPFMTEIFRGTTRDEMEFENDRVIRSSSAPIAPQPQPIKSQPSDTAPSDRTTSLTPEKFEKLLETRQRNRQLLVELMSPPSVVWRGAVAAASDND